MKPHNPLLRTSAFPSLMLDSPRCSNPGNRVMPLKRVIVLASALFLVPITQSNLLAQQAPNNGQYPPDQQSADQQPNYPQQQPNGEQSYPQPAYPDPDQSSQQPGYEQAQSQNVQPLSVQDLEQLVAPIALYPDALVAQILTASTYPEQVADADRWRRAQGYASPDQIAEGADWQSWDPSVKALTAFPQVLAQMDRNLYWTSVLGNAYYNQPQDLLDAVQAMRQRARAAGTLQSTPQQAVDYDQGNIVLRPVNPQVVYVPSYDPWTVYGQPVSPYPGFSLLGAVGSFIGSSFGPAAVRFGMGIAMTAFTHTPFGLLAWGLNWLTQSVLFNGSNYFSNSTTVADWGFPHGGPRAFSQRGAMAGLSNRGYRGFGGYGRPGGGYRGTHSQAFARTHDQDAYARNRMGESHYQRSGPGYGRTSRETYNRFQPAVARSQPYRSQSFGSQRYGGSPGYGRSAETGSRVRSSYGDWSRANRASSENFRRSDSGRHSSGSFRGNGFARDSGKHAHLGSSHFGGGHAPKSSGFGKSFSHSHSAGGGHGHSGGGHSGGKHHH